MNENHILEAWEAKMDHFRFTNLRSRMEPQMDPIWLHLGLRFGPVLSSDLDRFRVRFGDPNDPNVVFSTFLLI